MIRPYGNHQRQADGGPDRVAPANPIPETKHAVSPNAKCRHLVESRGNRREMRSHRRLAQLLHNPAPGGLGIGHRLDGGEGLGGDEEKRCRRVEVFNVSAICAPSTLDT